MWLGNTLDDVKDSAEFTYDYRNLPTRIEFNLAEDLLLNIGSPITGVRLFRALNTITTQNDFIIESSGNVTMQAGNTITLSPGFTAQQGSDFHAAIGGISGDPQAGEVVYTYNRVGQVESVGRPGDPDFYASYTYDADGSLAQEKLNNGSIIRNYHYNSPGWLTEIDDDFFKQSIDYTSGGYGGAGYYNGNIAKISHEFKWAGAEQDYFVQFQYDNLNQLKVADHDLSSLQSADIGVGAGNETVYDANGNILQITVGGATKTYTYYPGSNKVQNTDGSGNDYVYDANGNIIVSTPKNLSSLSYDPFTQMTNQITTSSSEQIGFEYGGENQRVLKSFDDQTVTSSTLYLHGQNDYPLMEKNKTNTTPETRVIYIYGPTGLLAMQKDGEVYYALKDHLGSIRVLVDESATVAAYFDYAPFGNLMRSGVNTDILYRYTGQEFDAESGLHNFRARLYDDELFRFYAMDPAGQTPSPYLYAGNSPLIMVDPDGEFFQAIIIGAMIGGYFGTVQAQMNGDLWYQGLLKGALVGAVGGAIGGNIAAQGLLENIGVGALSGGVTGGLNNALNNEDIWKGIYQGAAWGAAISGTIETISYLSKSGQANNTLIENVENLSEIEDPEYINKAMNELRESGGRLGREQYYKIKINDTRIITDNAIDSYGYADWVYDSVWDWVLSRNEIPRISINASLIFNSDYNASLWSGIGVSPNDYVAKTAQTIYHESGHLFGLKGIVNGQLKYFTPAQLVHLPGAHGVFSERIGKLTYQWFVGTYLKSRGF